MLCQPFRLKTQIDPARCDQHTTLWKWHSSFGELLMRLLLALGALIALALPLHAGEFTVGFAEKDLTPEVGAGKKPVYLAGFGQNRKATKVHDPIMARAI